MISIQPEPEQIAAPLLVAEDAADGDVDARLDEREERRAEADLRLLRRRARREDGGERPLQVARR